MSPHHNGFLIAEWQREENRRRKKRKATIPLDNITVESKVESKEEVEEINKPPKQPPSPNETTRTETRNGQKTETKRASRVL